MMHHMGPQILSQSAYDAPHGPGEAEVLDNLVLEKNYFGLRKFIVAMVFQKLFEMQECKKFPPQKLL